ncbi:cellulose synthase subunit BcsC-related outer membrane protein [Acidithiobacillus sp. AMEEHan]|uniref:cellulose synthase subunit BcsC-related outer membrane protein n=1 Tax=Acidithiobacillus sp. AMEEHan TaxID=2994951 RepID=UPI0027E4C951|nr:cellulose synthase subunit BcsC-related outer membrane protein [Acidithiobacillus sp. AMEEHan]
MSGNWWCRHCGEKEVRVSMNMLVLVILWNLSQPALAAVVNQNESTNVVEQINGEQGAGSPELDAAVKDIWQEINRKDIISAMADIRATEKRFHGWHPSAEMEFVISEVRVWQEIKNGTLEHAKQELEDFISRYDKGAEAQQERKVKIRMQGALMDRLLWNDLQQGLSASEMRAKIKAAERQIPGYHSPSAIMRVLAANQAADDVPGLAGKGNWAAIIKLAQSYPAVFSTEKYPENALLLAHAQALTGNPLAASRYYHTQILTSKSLGQTQRILEDASDVLPEFIINILYKEALVKYPGAAMQLEQWHLRYLLGLASRWHIQGQNLRAWRILQPKLSAIERARRPDDAKLVAAILGAVKQNQASLHWWLLAARWSGKEEDWQTAGNLAMADGATTDVAQALAHLKPDSPQRQAIYEWYLQQLAASAFQHKDYERVLYYLREWPKTRALPVGMQRIKAWSLVHQHEYARADELFRSLYLNDPRSSGDAAGVALASYNDKSLGSAYALAKRVQGSLPGFLPMSEMAKNVPDINLIPWTMNGKGQVTEPLTRASFLLLGVGWMHRGGAPANSSQLEDLAPGLIGQWGLNWHYAAFARLHASWLQSNIQSLESTTPLGAAQLRVQPSGSLSGWLAPSILLGVDDRMPRYLWRIGVGWTSPSNIDGGSPQAILEYRHNIGAKDSYWEVNATRDAVRQTWTSYHGTSGILTISGMKNDAIQIPYQWGAAMRNQVGFAGYWSGQKTMSWNYLASFHINAVTGENIRNNYGWDSYLSAMKPIFVDDSWWSAIGPALYSEGYAHNENFSTPGYGNYYSPKWLMQPQLSAAVSHWWSNGSLSLAAAVGYQWAHTNAAPFLGKTAAAVISQAAVGQSIGEFAAADTRNLSGSLELRVTQELAKNWYLDGSVIYQASPAFSQSNVGLAVRYVFSGVMPKTLSFAGLVGNMWRQYP